MGPCIQVPTSPSKQQSWSLRGGIKALLVFLLLGNLCSRAEQNGSGGSYQHLSEYEGSRIPSSRWEADVVKSTVQVGYDSDDGGVQISEVDSDVRHTTQAHNSEPVNGKNGIVENDWKGDNDSDAESSVKEQKTVNHVCLSPLSRTKRDEEPITFDCPTDRCEIGNCFLGFPVRFNRGKWVWGTLNLRYATIIQISSKMMKVTYSSAHYEGYVRPELWCFTKQQLSRDPDCAKWEVNFQFFPNRLLTCTRPDDDQGGATMLYYSSIFTVNTARKGNVDETSPSTVTKVNSAVSLMLEYAQERHLTKCWLCQNMPKSMYSPMFVPIPFSKADYLFFNWNDLASRMKEGADDCYSPAYPTGNSDYLKYMDLAKDTVKEVNAKYLPSGANHSVLLRINSVHPYIQVVFQYKMYLTLVQTNCTKPAPGLLCVPQISIPSILVEAIIEIQPWFGTKSFVMINLRMHNCSMRISDEKTPLRDCSTYMPPVLTQELQNVSLCFQGWGRTEDKDLGQSRCNVIVNVVLRQAPLPERVYLVCGNKAYSCMPHILLKGTCYLAYLVPMIREVQAEEMATRRVFLHRRRREINTFQAVTSILVPSYGVYVSQQEIKALSKVLESHLNASSKAMLAENKELQEVKTVALQNRMALDLLLAAQGGTCKVLGSECCSYISDATTDVMNMVHDTAQGIKELHENHGLRWDFTGLFGSWGEGVVKLLATIVIVLIAVLLLITCFIIGIKALFRCVTEPVMQAQQVVVNNDVEQMQYFQFQDLNDGWIPPGYPNDDESGSECECEFPERESEM